jgi:hypothetical protein
VSEIYTPATGISRALLRGASSVLACEAAIDREDVEAAVCHLSDLREALAELERLAAAAKDDTELLEGRQLAMLRRSEQKLVVRYSELARRSNREGA